MRQWKLYRIVVPSLFVLFFATIVACSQPSSTIEEQPPIQKPAELEVGPIDIEPPVVMVGDSVTLIATIKNDGDIAGTYTAVLLVDGQEVNRKDVPVDPRSNGAASFQLSKTTAGIYKLAIGNSSAVLIVHNWSPYIIQYANSDGSPIGAYVDGEKGHIVHFTPPNKAFRIEKIRIFGATKIKDNSELKNHITVRIWDKEGNNQLWSQDFLWSLFLGENWQEIKVPAVRVNDDFEVEVVTHSQAQGDPIDFALIAGILPAASDTGGTVIRLPGLGAGDVRSAVLIGCDSPPSYIDLPSYHPETRSGYSYMGKLIDPGPGRLKGIRWLISVEGEGAAGN